MSADLDECLDDGDDYEPQLIVQCDYCARYVPIDDVLLGYEIRRDLDGGRVLVYAAAHCSSLCARHGRNSSISNSRG